MRYLPYNVNLKTFARELRNNSTLAEILLWNQLKARQMIGYQFYRQKPIENFVVDFYCPALKLIIEADGLYHDHPEQQVDDATRQQKLEEWKLNFLRFTNHEIEKNMPAVLQAIEEYILAYEAEHPEVKKFSQRS